MWSFTLVRKEGFERRESIDMPSLDEEEPDESDPKVSSFVFKNMFSVLMKRVGLNPWKRYRIGKVYAGYFLAHLEWNS